jgi:hypothetical protein
MCLALFEPPQEGSQSHEQKIDELRRLFPKTKRWIDWWTMVDVEAMLFPTQRAEIIGSGHGDDNLPNTTNTQESMHCLHYMIRCTKLTNPPLICIFTSLIISTLLSFSEGKKCLMVGMAELFAFVQVL